MSPKCVCVCCETHWKISKFSTPTDDLRDNANTHERAKHSVTVTAPWFSFSSTNDWHQIQRVQMAMSVYISTDSTDAMIHQYRQLAMIWHDKIQCWDTRHKHKSDFAPSRQISSHLKNKCLCERELRRSRQTNKTTETYPSRFLSFSAIDWKYTQFLIRHTHTEGSDSLSCTPKVMIWSNDKCVYCSTNNNNWNSYTH